ncbi:MAG: DapH/DapD/GlmU-related protein [Bacteroidota bacterium]
MINIHQYLKHVPKWFSEIAEESPWNITPQLPELILKKINTLGDDYIINNNIAVHKRAVIEEHVILKGPMIISQGCFVGAHAYLRAGVFLGERVVVGPGCEIKSSVLLENSSLAHFNFAGNSIIGSHVNMEAGAVIANHYNERQHKIIDVMVGSQRISTGVDKFGALIGDGCKIGANAVLSPGTILPPGTIVKRLMLVEQCE